MLSRKRSPFGVARSLSFSACFAAGVVACSSSTPSTPVGGADASASADGSVLSDAGAASDTSDGAVVGECTITDSAKVDGLTKALSLWRWSKQVSGGNVTDLDECDSTIAYRFGPAAFVPPTTISSYAACAVARGSVIEVSTGSINRPGSCPTIACTPPSLGLLWNTATSGSVFALDAKGKPTGQVVFNVILESPASMLWTAAGAGGNGYRMSAMTGDTSDLPCK